MLMNNDRAAYRVLASNGFYADENLWKEGEELYFDGEPNEELEPLNDLAKERLTSYLNQLDDLARLAANKLGRPFVGRPRNLDGALVLATEIQRAQMNIMGVRKDPSQTERIEKEQTPETGRVGRGRPRKDNSVAA